MSSPTWTNAVGPGWCFARKLLGHADSAILMQRPVESRRETGRLGLAASGAFVRYTSGRQTRSLSTSLVSVRTCPMLPPTRSSRIVLPRWLKVVLVVMTLALLPIAAEAHSITGAGGWVDELVCL